MLYNVSQLLREPVGARREYEVDADVDLPIEGEQAAGVTGPLELIRTPAGLLARASLSAETHTLCSRCLGRAALPLELEIEEEFFPTVDPVSSARLPDPEDPEAFRIDDQHHLDLTEAVRQAAVLAQPMQPLCREDCPGLCPECGADLNEGACGCQRGPADVRWSALHGLKVE